MNLSRLALVAALALFAAFTTTTTSHALDGQSLLNLSENADKLFSYQGTKFADISVGDHTTRAVFRVVHEKPDRTRTDYLGPAGLAGIVTISRPDGNWTYLSVRKVWEKSKWDPVGPSVSLAMRNYTPVKVGRGKIAKRPAHIVKLLPKKPGNPSETIWIDTVTYLPLRSELRNSAGALISVSAFRDIVFNPKNIRPSLFASENIGTPIPRPPIGDLGFKVVMPGYLPRGYELVRVANIRIGTGLAAHLMYSNGVNSISIFERKRGTDKGQKPPGLGKWANVVRFDRGMVTFTIISDISIGELRRIAGSLK